MKIHSAFSAVMLEKSQEKQAQGRHTKRKSLRTEKKNCKGRQIN